MGGAAVYDYAQIDLGVPSKVAPLICGAAFGFAVIVCRFDVLCEARQTAKLS